MHIFSGKRPESGRTGSVSRSAGNVSACLQRAGTLRWARGREGCSDSPLPTSGLHPLRNATTATAASGGNREQLLGQRPARRECRPRHEADAGCRNPLAEAIQNRPSSKRSRRTSSVQRLLLMVAYFRLKVAGSKSGSSQLRVMISVRSFRMAMECSK